MQRMSIGPERRTNRRGLIVLIVLVVLALLGILYWRGALNRVVRNVRAVQLRCAATQDIKPFGDSLLYYDGDTLFCLGSDGREKWNYMVGTGASFDPGNQCVVVWRGSQLSILNRSGRSTYDDNIGAEIQFARAGDKYVVTVCDDNTSADEQSLLAIRDMNGNVQDTETGAYTDMLILDAGFFKTEYLLTTAMELYGTVPSTTLNTIRVNSMTTGSIDLGETLTYKVIYAGSVLNVIGTRQLRKYDYNGSQDTSGTVLVYGWKLIDDTVIDNRAYLLFAPTRQTNDLISISELRCLYGSNDKRLTLPSECIGAGFYGRRVYGFSDNSIFRADLNANRFSVYSLPLPSPATADLGMLSDGTALIACGNEVYAVTVP